MNEEKVCGDCLYFKLISYPFIGKGLCINPKSKYCYKSAWTDDCTCEEFIADMRGEK